MADGAMIEAGEAYFGIFAKLRALNLCDSNDVDLYESGLADFYNEFVGSFAGDIPIFERLMPRPEARVLDLACGSARIGIQLARLGACVDGLELSGDMLALAEKHILGQSDEIRGRLNLIRGDMTSFELKGRYDLVILGVTSISLLLRREQRQALFRCVATHLATGGRFVFDILDLEGDRWLAMDNYQDVWSAESQRGMDVAIVGQKFYPEQRSFTLNVYREVIDWDGNTQRTIGFSKKAWIGRDELVNDLGAAGLIVMEEFHEAEQLYFVAARASEVKA